MRSPWQYLRGWFARVGSDPYYASYDRSLGNIKAELDRIQVRGVVVAGGGSSSLWLGPARCSELRPRPAPVVHPKARGLLPALAPPPARCRRHAPRGTRPGPPSAPASWAALPPLMPRCWRMPPTSTTSRRAPTAPRSRPRAWRPPSWRRRWAGPPTACWAGCKQRWTLAPPAACGSWTASCASRCGEGGAAGVQCSAARGGGGHAARACSIVADGRRCFLVCRHVPSASTSTSVCCTVSLRLQAPPQAM